MISLHVNIDHVATVRQARRGIEPETVVAVGIVELAGADGITIHLREDRRHILDRDVRLIREIVQTRLNLEMAATDGMFGIALEIRPDIVTIVPEKREEITTEGGLDVLGARKTLESGIRRLKDSGIRASFFIDPDPPQIEASADSGANDIELHTGSYANAPDTDQADREFERLKTAADMAHRYALQVNAGHGLNYQNTQRICHLPHLRELNIGHSIISRAVFTGLGQAVREMKDLIKSEWRSIA